MGSTGEYLYIETDLCRCICKDSSGDGDGDGAAARTPARHYRVSQR